MKRTITCIVLTLMLSLLLNGCAETADRGNVGTSPVPEVTSPTQILPSPDVSASPIPDERTGSGNQGVNDSGTNADTGSTSSPAPTSAAR